MAPPGYVPTNSFPRAAVMRGYGWNIVKAEDFPENALKERREGLARAVLALDKAGAITSCKIETSSGHADLDARTCILLKERAAFEPALDIKGRVTAARISTGIDWRLPPPKSASIEKVASAPKPLIERALPKPENLVMIMSIDETGKLVGCQRAKRSTTLLPEAFAVGARSLQARSRQRHYDVQMIGGIVLHAAKSPKCAPVRARRWSPRCPSISTRWKARASTSSRSTITSPAATPNGWGRSTAFLA
jgi:TonB family protein